ncbi:MAG: family 78 glycoside hydrolase catalytic domain [Clostridia bacterium]|nr:family 78 glycoside hydrolase catalytic domain [Clostridia bacterium]
MKQAKWIWAHNDDRADEFVRFYQTFHTTGKSVSIDISCDSNYELYVNGVLAAFGQFSDYPYYKVFDRVDITKFCREGENQLQLLVWYYGSNDFFTYYKGLPGVIYEISEGDRILTASDKNTLCRVATDYVSGRQKQITQQLGFSYTYDANGYDGFYNKDFSAQDYQSAIEVEGRPEELHARPLKKTVLKPFANAVLVDSAKQIYDIGEETVGHLGIRFRAEKGAKVTVAYGEHLVTAEDGSEVVPQIIKTRDFSIELIANGEWFEFANHMRRLGGRYFQIISDAKVEIDYIGLYPVEYPVNVLPFDAGNPLRQRIYDISVRTLRLCMYEHYEDCPWREQSLYGVDSRNQMLCCYDGFEEYEFAKASLILFGLDQRDDNMTHICSPSNFNYVIPYFSLVYPMQMKEYVERSGDLALAERFYERMQALVKAFTDRMENGLVPNFYEDLKTYWNFYEWSPTLDGYPKAEQNKEFEIVLNAQLSMSVQAMAYFAEKLGKSEESASYASLAQVINKRIHEVFYSEAQGLYLTQAEKESCSELGNAYAILCGAAPSGVAEKICEVLSSANDLVPATLSMKAFKYDALLMVNEEKYAENVLNEIDKNYAYMLNQGATSFWETLKGAEDFHNAGSLCHGWSAIPIIYYHRLLKK